MTAARTATGIACAKCSHWDNRLNRKIQIFHPSIADVRECCSGRSPMIRTRTITVHQDDIDMQRMEAEADRAESMRDTAAKWKDRADSLRQPAAPAKVDVPEGRYAIGPVGETKFYSVEKGEGRWKGYTFVKVQASDDLYNIRNRQERERILAEIGQDVEAAMVRYGKELGHCGVCNRTLTKPESIARGMGRICYGKMGF